METVLSADTLRKIHEKVYLKFGYPNVEEGLRALKRARKWHSGNLLSTDPPPAGIKDKLVVWANITGHIETEIIKQKEVKRAKLEAEKTPHPV